MRRSSWRPRANTAVAQTATPECKTNGARGEPARLADPDRIRPDNLLKHNAFMFFGKHLIAVCAGFGHPSDNMQEQAVFEIDRQSAASRKTATSGNLVLLRHVESEQARARDAVATGADRRAMIVPVLLVLVLAVGAIALRPDAAQLCAKLGDFPCGP